MKKTTMIILVMVCLASLVIAGVGIISLDKDVELSKPQRDALADINLTKYNTTDYSRGTDLIERCLTRKDAINKCKIFNVTGLSEANKTAKLDLWEEETIELIADVKIKRDVGNVRDKIGEGVTTIKEIK